MSTAIPGEIIKPSIKRKLHRRHVALVPSIVMERLSESAIAIFLPFGFDVGTRSPKEATADQTQPAHPHAQKACQIDHADNFLKHGQARHEVYKRIDKWSNRFQRLISSKRLTRAAPAVALALFGSLEFPCHLPRASPGCPAAMRRATTSLAQLTRTVIEPPDLLRRSQRQSELQNAVAAHFDFDHNAIHVGAFRVMKRQVDYIPGGRGMPRIRQNAAHCSSLMRVCRGTGAWAKLAGLTQMSCSRP